MLATITHKITRNTNPRFWESNRPDCNCGSYALNLSEWFTPYDTWTERVEFIANLILKGRCREQILEKLIDHDRSYILEHFPELRSISEKEAVGAGSSSTIIAYRVGLYFNEDVEWDKNTIMLSLFDESLLDTDFHFKIFKGGKWKEKNGSLDIRSCELYPRDNWYCTDELDYDSEIIYFRKLN